MSTCEIIASGGKRPAQPPRRRDADREPCDVLVVDPHGLVLDGLTTLLGSEDDLEVVLAVTTGRHALDAAVATAPDVVVVEPDLHDEDGLRLITGLSRLARPPRILVLSARDAAQDLWRALAAGADSYIVKRSPHDVVVDAIHRTLDGETVISSELVFAIVDEPGAQGGLRAAPQLTGRERQVLEAIGDGATSAEIADRAGSSVRTVHKHVQSLFDKLAVTNRAEMVAVAFRQRLLQ